MKTGPPIFALIFLSLFCYLAVNNFELPTFFLFDKTEKVRGTVIKTDWSYGYRGRRIQLVTYEFQVNDSFYTDQFRNVRRAGLQAVGDEIVVQYAVNKPQKNEVTGFFKEEIPQKIRSIMVSSRENESNSPLSDIEIPNQTTVFTFDTVANRLAYQKFLEEIQFEKKEITEILEAKKYLFEVFNTNISDFWTGTIWDFNGITRHPKEGAIACGYFVTHTLTDVGFKIQRNKLAQAPSSEMIKELCVTIKRFSDFNKLKTHIQQEPDNSLFIIGLDFHTGFILKSKDEIFFLHSNYINNQGVIKEQIDTSMALASSRSYMIGNLTQNEDLIKKWLGN